MTKNRSSIWKVIFMFLISSPLFASCVKMKNDSPSDKGNYVSRESLYIVGFSIKTCAPAAIASFVGRKPILTSYISAVAAIWGPIVRGYVLSMPVEKHFIFVSHAFVGMSAAAPWQRNL